MCQHSPQKECGPGKSGRLHRKGRYLSPSSPSERSVTRVRLSCSRRQVAPLSTAQLGLQGNSHGSLMGHTRLKCDCLRQMRSQSLVVSERRVLPGRVRVNDPKERSPDDCARSPYRLGNVIVFFFMCSLLLSIWCILQSFPTMSFTRTSQQPFRFHGRNGSRD